MEPDGLTAGATAPAHRGRALPITAAGVVALYAGLGLAPAAFMTGDRRPGAAGIALALAGAAAVVVAARIVLRGRRLRVQVAVAVVAAFALLEWVVLPAVTAGLAVHAPTGRIPSVQVLGLPAARDVWFDAADGTVLAGWYVPSRTGAAVVVLHGSHGDRTDLGPYVRLLARSGLGVLAFDARGHGESSGRANALGWMGADDLAGAVAYLRARGVARGRIGALGLSMGAEEALRAAAEGVPLSRVVADGAGASTQGDSSLVSHGLLSPLAASTTWLAMRGVELATGEQEPTALKDVVARIHAPVLLIASSRKDERRIDEAYAARMPRAWLWYLAGTDHTAGLKQHPELYRSRVLSFLSGL